MSDTQAKIEQRRKEAHKRKEQNQRAVHAKIKRSTKQKIKVTAVVVVLVLLVAALIVPSMGITKRLVTALTIGNVKISTAEYSYYYRASFDNYYQTMVSYMGADNVPISLSRSLERQEMSDGQTYADYFSQNAIDQLQNLVLLSEEAKKENFTLPEESQEQLDTLLANLESAAQSAGATIDQYLSNNYGTGFNLDLFRQCIERELLAQAYQLEKSSEGEYTQEEIDAYYAEHEQDFQIATFRMQSFSVIEEAEGVEGVTAEEAKANAEAFLEQVTDEASFADASLARAQEKAAEGEEAEDSSLAENVGYSSISQIDTNLADWVYSGDVQPGDTAVVESADGSDYYAVYMVTPPHRDETLSVNVRQIFVSVSDMENEDAYQTGQDKANDLLAQWEENGGTEEAFAELANSQSDDTGSNTNGGLYENVVPGEMVVNFNDWCFDEARQVGDTGIVESSSGFHVIYYCGQSEPTWQVQVQEAMSEADYDAFYEEALASYPVTTHRLGLWLRNEPI